MEKQIDLIQNTFEENFYKYWQLYNKFEKGSLNEENEKEIKILEKVLIKVINAKEYISNKQKTKGVFRGFLDYFANFLPYSKKASDSESEKLYSLFDEKVIDYVIEKSGIKDFSKNSSSDKMIDEDLSNFHEQIIKNQNRVEKFLNCSKNLLESGIEEKLKEGLKAIQEAKEKNDENIKLMTYTNNNRRKNNLNIK